MVRQYPCWMKYKVDKVWAAGYDRDFVPGSDEVRTVVIKHRETLYIVCEHELQEWGESDDTKSARLTAYLTEIIRMTSKSLADNNFHSPQTVAADLMAIRALAKVAVDDRG